jgi:prohibitin 1
MLRLGSCLGEAGVVMRSILLTVISLPLFACATVPSGQSGVVLHMDSIDPETLAEGVHWVGPFDSVENYDLRSQQHSEDLEALSADGAPLEAHASIVTFHPVPAEVVDLARETGPDYYRVLVQPLLRSSLRRVLAGFRADELDSAGIGAAEQAVTEDAARRLRTRHIVLDSVTLRTLRLSPRTQAYREVVATGVTAQEVLTARQLIALAQQRADALRTEAGGIAASRALIAPTLSPRVLADEAQRAWTRLLTATSTHVEVRPGSQPYLLEVNP